MNEFVLEDLGKVERLFEQLTENVGKFYSNKSRKIQGNLETLEKLLKRATFAPVAQKKKGKEGKETKETLGQNEQP